MVEGGFGKVAVAIKATSCQVNFSLSPCSCLIVTKIWDGRLITAYRDRISQFLSQCSKDSKRLTGYSLVSVLLLNRGDSTFPRHGSRLTPKEWQWALSASVFILPVSSWSALCRTRLVPTTSQERECKQAYAQGWLVTASCMMTGGQMLFEWPYKDI